MGLFAFPINLNLIMSSLLKKDSLEMTETEYQTKTKEIIRCIDLIQTQITEDQEEIQSLAKETDELLNQLEYKAS